MFMYVPLAANTTQTSEGTVGNGIPVSVLTTTSTIGEYADYANFSSLSLATAIDNTVENVARELAYRLGESLSALVRTTADGANGIDSSVLTQLAAASLTSFTTLSLNQIRDAVQSLAGRSVRPFDEASKAFCGVSEIAPLKILLYRWISDIIRQYRGKALKKFYVSIR